jgi:hypothetical protein
MQRKEREERVKKCGVGSLGRNYKGDTYWILK